MIAELQNQLQEKVHELSKEEELIEMIQDKYEGLLQREEMDIERSESDVLETK